MKPLLISLDYTLTESFLLKEISTPYFQNKRHFHEDYELVYVVESSGNRVIGNHMERFQKGDLVFVGPNLPHAWYNDKDYYEENSSLIARSIVIYFKRSWLENDLLKLPHTNKIKSLLNNASRGIKVTGKTRSRIGSILLKINESAGMKKVVDIFSVLHELSETTEFSLLDSGSSLKFENANEAHRINDVYEYVMNNFSGQVSLEQAAEIANMSINAFCRYFKKHTQKQFSQFINEVRIGHACKLLEGNSMPVSQICYESGFQSMTNFNKFFKKYTKQTPLEYRKALLTFGKRAVSASSCEA